MTDEVWYPDTDDVLAIHEDVVAEDDESEVGVRSRESIGSALAYVSVGYFGEAPDTIHAKAAHLVRLLVAEHPFVDGNKRTALNTVAVFYELNGYEFIYGDERIRGILKQFAIDADAVDMDDVIAYLGNNVHQAEE